MVEQSQVWIGSQDSIIYLINTHSMSCNKQLNDHRSEVVDIIVKNGDSSSRSAEYGRFSCSKTNWDCILCVRDQGREREGETSIGGPSFSSKCFPQNGTMMCCQKPGCEPPDRQLLEEFLSPCFLGPLLFSPPLGEKWESSFEFIFLKT